MNSIYNLQYEYIQNDGNYLILLGDGSFLQTDLTNLQVKMLQANPVPRLLNLEIEENNLDIRLRYNLNRTKMLTSLLQANHIKINEYYQLLLNIVTIIDDSKIYMLNEQNYILDLNFIFVGRDNNDIYLVYLPIKEINKKLTIQTEIKNLIFELSAYIDIHEEKNISELITFVDDNYFNIISLKQKLITLLTEKKAEEKISIPHPRPNSEDNQKLKPLSDRQKTIMLATSFFIIAIIWRGYLDYQFASIFYISLGFTLLIININFILLKIWRPNCKVKRYKHKTHIEKNKVIDSFNHYQGLQKQTRILVNSDETVFINEEHAASKQSPLPQACLLITRGFKTEKIIIDKDSFLIGRNSNQVNYTESAKGVSRLHLEIRQNLSGFMIRDLGSKNGTFLNNQRLIPHKLYPINNGDILKIAKVEFTFKDLGCTIGK